MPSYRFFKLNSDSKITKPAAVVDFTDDREALRYGKTLAVGHTVEIWSGARRVGIVPSKDGVAVPL